MSEILACSNLRKSFGERVAVDGLSFSILAGEVVGLLGPNGAGKTTTISMICGLIRCDEGEIRVAGQAVTPGARRAKASIGYVPQEVALWGGLTARENLEFFGRLQGLRRNELRARTNAALDAVALTSRADDRVESFSGGMKRRANIAVALLHEPALLVFDEPTVGVDPQSRNAILEHVERLASAGHGVLFASHYMNEVQRVCRTVVVVDGGRMIVQGPPGEVGRPSTSASTVHLRCAQPPTNEVIAVLAADPAVASARLSERGGIEIALGEDDDIVLARVVAAVEHAGHRIVQATRLEADLETMFLELTGHTLRD